MPLKFTIIDYTTNPSGHSTVVNEPVGWDSTTLRLKRDKNWRGFFDFFDDSYNQMQWHGTAMHILKNAYETNGVDANCQLNVEYACSDTDIYKQVYSGKFVFARYALVCADYCYVLCGVDNTGCLMAFKNRYDQKVNLDTLNGFDSLCDTVEVSTVTIDFYSHSGTTTNIKLYGTVFLTDLVGQWLVITGSNSQNGYYLINTATTLSGDTMLNVEGIITLENGVVCNIKTGCLQPYSMLGKQIVLPSKKILRENSWEIANTVRYYTDDVLSSEVISTPANYYFAFDWTIDNLTEINTSNRFEFLDGFIDTATSNPFFELQNIYSGIIDIERDSTLQCSYEFEIDIRIDGALLMQTIDTVIDENAKILLLYGKPGEFATPITLQSGLTSPVNAAINVNYSGTITLTPGDRIYLVYAISGFRYLTGGGGGGPADPFDLTITINSASLSIKATQECENTSARVYMVNETLSRMAEAYTNNCLKVKSNYFGRVDSLPYQSITDGCGALECLTSGLIIRSRELEKVRIGSEFIRPSFQLSFKDAFESLKSIHNIGMGIEENTEDGGEWIRVEPVSHFFNNSVLITCTAINELKTAVDQEMIYSRTAIGYNKWSTEIAQGLNDIFTKREYRTSQKATNSLYQMLSNFIASDYAIEVTRQQFGSNTKDWRYDNDTFIICLTKKILVMASFVVNGADDSIILQGNEWASLFEVGQSIEVTNSVSNNGTYTITSVTFTVSLTIIKVAETLVNESLIQVNIENITVPTLSVEQGNVTASGNIIYPETAYNLRISPARNAMRHFKSLVNCYRDYANGTLIFTNGEGNYLADLELINDSCILESGSLPENSDINTGLFNDAVEATPIYWPELVTFEYPVTWQQYLVIKDNPYGLIGYQCGSGPMQYGWIEDFQLKPYTGMGQFTLRPKIES
jgi:hypothetical protein